MKEKKLTDKQKRFCEEYLTDHNATQASIRAGYSKNTADKIGNQLLGKTRVKEYIDELEKPIKDECIKKFGKEIADKEELMKKLTSIIRGESKSHEVVIEGQGIGISNAREIERSPREVEILKAIDSLGKMLGAFENKVELDVNVSPIQINAWCGDEEEEEEAE